MKTYCKHGHPLSDNNLYVAPDGEWGCRECIRVRQRAHYAANREKILARKRTYDAAHRENKLARARAYDKENILTHGGKRSNSVFIGSQNEQRVAAFFNQLGMVAERQGHNAPFDIAVERTFRVEVKSAYLNRRTRHVCPSDYQPEKSDLLIMVAPNGTLYFRPSNHLGVALLLSVHFIQETLLCQT